MKQVHDSILDLIGNTPIVRVNSLDVGPCELYVKLETQNPGGSIKDRIGLKMIEDAEQAGLIKPGSTLVEGTAGNTGLALALVAAQKGYRLILVIPDKMSREKISNVKAMGAEVVLTRSDVGKGHPEYYQDLARRIADETPNSFFINQFGNPSNPAAHETITGPEIWRQMDGELDALVVGVGSSGTVTGLFSPFRATDPQLVVEIDRDRALTLGVPVRGVAEALEDLAVEMYARGLSTRDIEAALCDEKGRSLLSRTAVSQVTERLWEEYEAFASRDLSEYEIEIGRAHV